MPEVTHLKPLSVLTFDLENRPLSYLGQDWTSAEVTAMGWSFGESVTTMTLDLEGRYRLQRGDGETVLYDADRAFQFIRNLIAGADIVTGHYIRKHDLPILNTMFMEQGILPLPKLLVCDTKEDLAKRRDLSVSQENLSALFNLSNPKHHMTQSEWREANRLTPLGIAGSRERVSKDVVQHMELRKELVKRGLLQPPRYWKSFR